VNHNRSALDLATVNLLSCFAKIFYFFYRGGLCISEIHGKKKFFRGDKRWHHSESSII